MKGLIQETKDEKQFRSENYNFNLDKKTGEFERWGRTLDDDPDYSPFGPEILDLEISTSVRPEEEHLYDKDRLVYDEGCRGQCGFCYKSNGKYPTYNMTLGEFKIIFNKLPKTVGQIAFGILNIGTNPDFFKMMEYASENGVKPNYTCHGLDVTEEYAKRTSELCGAVAVSVYNKSKSYDSIKKYTDAGMTQCNIHYMCAQESYAKAFEIMDDMSRDSRLKKMNAIVFLSLKQKGGGKDFKTLTTEQYRKLVQYALDRGIRFGFDSCGAHRFLDAVKDHPNYNNFKTMAEPCESSCFSSYINARGEYFACSFTEGHKDFPEVINVLEDNDFVKDVWNAKSTNKFRDNLLSKGRHCPLYKI
jgi:MoaA/NifB/PqqE/SkfB family radical SAM enzyme